MALSNTEFETILDDPSKKIVGDLAWSEDEDHSPSVEFRAEVQSEGGWPLFIRASYNPLAATLTYALILKTVGPVYRLDLGKDHHNPTCAQVGEKHKHRWKEATKDKDAYVPEDITVPVTDPVAVWKQFLAEVRMAHEGRLAGPPPAQGELFT
jgi:hypothetical protein